MSCTTLVDLKRRGLWQHPVRNRRMARLAKALRDGRPDLGGKDLWLRETLEQVDPSRILVLVENLEHAETLLRYLPGWPLVGASRRQALRREARVLGRADWDWEGRPPAIVTATAAEGLNLCGIEVILRLDGGVGLPPLSLPGCLETDGPDARPILLVDCLDQQNKTLRKRSRQRWSAYLKEGWTPAGMTPAQVAVEVFLKTRQPFGEDKA